MPSMANMTVKKADGTTDVVYTAKSPSAGDNTPAIWRNETVGTAASHRPELRLTFKEGADGKTRKGRATYVWPEIATNTTTGTTSVVHRSSAGVDFSLAKDMSSANINEFAYQFGNLFANALIKQCVADGFSAS